MQPKRPRGATTSAHGRLSSGALSQGLTNDHGQPPLFKLRRGTAPLLISMPHVGTFIPADIAQTMTDAALRLPDTDWHLERLYDFIGALDASVITATHSRYVIDLNRPRDDASLYPGQETTGLCPVDTFDRQPLYRAGCEPDAGEVQRRIDGTGCLTTRCSKAKQPGCANATRRWSYGTHTRSAPWCRVCSPADCRTSILAAPQVQPATRTLRTLFSRSLRATERYRAVLDGRFQGGYITRHYGRPAEGIHAVQLELAQITYMQEQHPYSFDESAAAELRPLLTEMLHAVLRWTKRLCQIAGVMHSQF